ncbi:MAG: EAL domain-containing protein, partial [Deltaproteobacteria bacterium]|nr:EAL domain-containing protein [Deltaproteobacteria bacterium]
VLGLDRLCRQKALENFSRIFKDEPRLMLWLNFEPGVLDQLKHQTGKLLEQVKAAGIDPGRIVIEILESKVSNTKALREFIYNYRELGFLIAIDDWGTAYSNMARIDQIKPDVIKVHRSLVDHLESAFYKQELIRSILNLARGIGALVVVEGVETEEAALSAMDLGASIIQGFYFCKPGDSWEIMQSRCEERSRLLSAAYKTRKIKMVNERRAYFKKIDAIAGDVKQALRDLPLSEYDRILERLIELHPELECLYILNENGIQLTKTVCSGRCLRQDSFLFHSPRKGTNRSLGDFFLLIQSGLARYVSEPYISKTTGNRCVTISRVFEAPGGRRLVFCADCDCHRETLRVAHSRQRISSVG